MSIQNFQKWATLGPAMVVPFIGSLIYFVLFSEYYFARIVYGAVKVFTVTWPLLCVLYVFHERFPKLEIPSSKQKWVLTIGLLSGLAIAGLMLGSMQTPLLHIAESGTTNITIKTRELGILDYYWICALLLSLINSFVEEYYWRWFIYGRLCGLIKAHWAHILSGIAFASHHTVVTIQYFGVGWGLIFGACVGAGGIIWSLMYDMQKTILGTWISHIIVDLCIFSIGHKLLFGTYI